MVTINVVSSVGVRGNNANFRSPGDSEQYEKFRGQSDSALSRPAPSALSRLASYL